MTVSGKDPDRWRRLLAHIDSAALAKIAHSLSEETRAAIAEARAGRQLHWQIEAGNGPGPSGASGEWPDTEPAWRIGDR